MTDNFIYEEVVHSRKKRAGIRVAKGAKNIRIGELNLEGVDNAVVFEGDAENVHFGSVNIKNGENPFFMNNMINSSINNVTIDNSRVLNREREIFNQSMAVEKDPFFRASLMGNHAMFLKSHLIFEEALELLINALNIFKELKEEESISLSYSNIGIIFKSLGLYDKAIKSYKLSLDLNMKIGNTAGIIANGVNIGIIYDLQGDNLKSIKEYEKCLLLSDGDFLYMRGQIYANLALAYNKIDINKSIDFYLKSIEFNERNKNYYYLAFDYRNLGLLYKEINNISLSTKYIMRSSDLFKKIGNNREEQRTKRHLNVVF